MVEVSEEKIKILSKIQQYIPSVNVAGLGVEPSLRDYEPRVHRTLSRVTRVILYPKILEKSIL